MSNYNDFSSVNKYISPPIMPGVRQFEGIPEELHRVTGLGINPRNFEPINIPEYNNSRCKCGLGRECQCGRGRGCTCGRGRGCTCGRGRGCTCGRGRGCTCGRGRGRGCACAQNQIEGFGNTKRGKVMFRLFIFILIVCLVVYLMNNTEC